MCSLYGVRSPNVNSVNGLCVFLRFMLLYVLCSICSFLRYLSRSHELLSRTNGLYCPAKALVAALYEQHCQQ